MASSSTSTTTTEQVILTDGSQAFDGGADSSKVTTISSDINPNGLDRNELAWLINAGVRDGGITPRVGWQYLATIHAGNALYQGGYMYEPLGAYPYLVLMIGGVPYAIDLVAYGLTDLSGGNPLLQHPANIEQGFIEQGEQFLIIQAGDLTTLPLFWNGATLSRSLGITNTAVAPGTPGVNEIPAAGAMVYYMGRLFWAKGRQVSGGDIVGGNSGTAPFTFKDAILNVTENPLVVGGDGFTIPTTAGNLRALKYNAAIDATLGQGTLYLFTRKQIYSLSVPVTRSDWIAADSKNQPLMKVVQHVNGSVNDRGVVAVNGDLFYHSLEPSIRSLLLAIRYFEQWGNTSISANEDRILNFNDRSLMHGASGIVFNNRLWMTALPFQTAVGIAHHALVPLDFDPISSFGKNRTPTWEGHCEGLDILQLFTGDFGGLERAFAVVLSRVDGTIQLWEMTQNERFDVTPDVKRITWVVETPAYTFSLPHKLKQLKGGELWFDRAYGTVTVKVYYRVDADPCWILWHEHEFCTAKTTQETVTDPIAYPQDCGEGYRWPIVLPVPPRPADSMGVRPANIGFQFQVKLVVTGFARLRTVLVYGVEQPRGIYHGLTKQNTPPYRQAMNVSTLPTP